jgi:FkbM family methyltransferase
MIHLQREEVITSVYGTRFRLRFPEDVGWEHLYVLGSYETGTSDLVSALLQDGDVAMDVGANLGWYSMLFDKCVRPTGSVHAFEPVPWIRGKFEENSLLNGIERSVTLNPVALGAMEKDLTLYTFSDISHGETSARPFDGAHVSSQVCAKCITMDQYIETAGLGEIALVKVDVEGGEQEVLLGSAGLLARKRPPMWILEVNFRNAAAFGWSPTDLLRSMQRDHGYQFIRMPTGWQQPERVQRVEECQHGDNVLCYRVDTHADRLSRWTRPLWE